MLPRCRSQPYHHWCQSIRRNEGSSRWRFEHSPFHQEIPRLRQRNQNLQRRGAQEPHHGQTRCRLHDPIGRRRSSRFQEAVWQIHRVGHRS